MHSNSKTGDATGQAYQMLDNCPRQDSCENLYNRQGQSQAGTNKKGLEFCFTPKTNTIGKKKIPSYDLDQSLGREVGGFEGGLRRSKKDP